MINWSEYVARDHAAVAKVCVNALLANRSKPDVVHRSVNNISQVKCWYFNDEGTDGVLLINKQGKKSYRRLVITPELVKYDYNLGVFLFDEGDSARTKKHKLGLVTPAHTYYRGICDVYVHDAVNDVYYYMCEVHFQGDRHKILKQIPGLNNSKWVLVQQ